MSNSTVEIGDIVSGRRSGWWRVIAIEDGTNGYNRGYKVAKLELVLDKHGKTPKKRARTDTYYLHWCQKIKAEDVESWRDQDCKKWDTLMKLVNPDAQVEHEEIAEEEIACQEKPEPKLLTILGPPPSLTGASNN